MAVTRLAVSIGQMAKSMLGADMVLQKYSHGQLNDAWHQKTFISTRWIDFFHSFDTLSTLSCLNQ